MNWLRLDFSSAFRLLHELNCKEYHDRKGNSCSLLQFLTRSINSCNTVAIHCVFSVNGNTHITRAFSLRMTHLKTRLSRVFAVASKLYLYISIWAWKAKKQARQAQYFLLAIASPAKRSAARGSSFGARHRACTAAARKTL